MVADQCQNCRFLAVSGGVCLVTVAFIEFLLQQTHAWRSGKNDSGSQEKAVVYELDCGIQGEDGFAVSDQHHTTHTSHTTT